VAPVLSQVRVVLFPDLTFVLLAWNDGLPGVVLPEGPDGAGVGGLTLEVGPVVGAVVGLGVATGLAVGTGVGVATGVQYVGLGVVSRGSQGVAAEAVST
jgi:hypothetical protein